MSAITGVELKQKLEDTIVEQLGKKCDYLFVGKNVTSINKNLQLLYNWWVITDQCVLTDDQINCIVNEIVVTCGFSPARKLIPANTESTVIQGLQQVKIEIPEQEIEVLDCFIERGACTAFRPPNGVGYDVGTASFTVNVTGGGGGLTYLWECETVMGYPASVTGSCVDWDGSAYGAPASIPLVLSGTTTATLSVSGIGFLQIHKFKVTVTDALGNTCVKSIEYDDKICSAGGY